MTDHAGGLAPAAGAARPSLGRYVVLAVGLAALAVTLYLPTLPHEFVYDDMHLVVANPRIRLPVDEWWRYVVPGRGGYRPLRNLSYAVDYQLGGLDPAAFRRTNIAWHAVATVATACLARALGLPWLAAGVAAGAFALHPVQTESVTYVSGRRDVLCGALFLIGVVAYVRWRRGGSRWWLAVVVTAAPAAMLAKEMAASFPLVCLLWEWCRAARGRRDRRYVALVLLLAGAVALALGVFYWRVLGAQFRDLPWHGGGITANFATVARIWVHYVGLLLYPAELVADYSGAYFPRSQGLLEGPVLLSGALIAGWLAVAVACRWRGRPVIAFAMLWLPVTLLPVSHLVPHGELMAEHYLYLPSVAVCLLAGIALAALARGGVARRAVAALLVLTIGGGLAWRTTIRNAEWKDQLTFYTTLARQNRYSPRVYLGLGDEYVRLRQPRLAVQMFSQGLRLAPESPTLLVNRGAAYMQTGQLLRAEADYRRAIDLGYDGYPLWNNLGLLYASLGRFREARHALRNARRRARGREASVLVNMALVVQAEGDPERAVRLFRRADRLDPGLGLADEIRAAESQLAPREPGAGPQTPGIPGA